VPRCHFIFRGKPAKLVGGRKREIHFSSCRPAWSDAAAR